MVAEPAPFITDSDAGTVNIYWLNFIGKSEKKFAWDSEEKILVVGFFGFIWSFSLKVLVNWLLSIFIVRTFPVTV